MVTVEDGDQIPGGHLEGVIDVARLGVLVGRPGHIADPGFLGEVSKRCPPPVVKQPYGQFVGRPVKPHGGVDSPLHDGEILVVGGDHQIHAGPLGRIRRQLCRRAVQGPCGLPVAEQQHQPGIGLGGQQQQAAGQADGIEPVEGRGVAPPDVAAGDGEGEHHHHQHGITARHGPQDEGHGRQQEDEHQLCLQGERLGDAEQREAPGHHAEQHALPARLAGRGPGGGQPFLLLAGQEGPESLSAPMPDPLPGGRPAQRDGLWATHYHPEALQQNAQGIPHPGVRQLGIEPPGMAQHPLPAMTLEGEDNPGQQPAQGQCGRPRAGSPPLAQCAIALRAPEARSRRQQPHSHRGASPSARHQVARAASSWATRLVGA